MKRHAAGGLALLLLAAALAACGDRGGDAAERNHTSVLGGFGEQHARSAADDTARLGLPPGAPHDTRIVRATSETALALWVRDGQAVAAKHTPATGWTAPQPLEEIYGKASDPQLAGNGRGSAMAVWRHTVGNIHSLRYSRFDSSGWSVPDVMPGALPQPASARAEPPRLEMDREGRVVAQWPSGFDSKDTQTARYVPGEGWSRALSAPLAAAPAAPRIVQ